MSASARSLRAQARRWVIAAVATAPGIAASVGVFAGEPAFWPVRGTASADAKLPPIVAPGSVDRPRPKTAGEAPPAKLGELPPSLASRLSRMRAASDELLHPQTSAEQAPEAPRSALSPWMQEIDPAVRSKSAAKPKAKSPAEYVEPVQFQSRIENPEAKPTAKSVQPTISELPAEENTAPIVDSSATARSGIGKPRGPMAGGLGRMLGIKPVVSPSSGRTTVREQPPAVVVVEAAEQAAGDVMQVAAAEPQAPSSSDQAECRRLEEKLCELFPGREVQILIGRSPTAPSDQGNGQIIAIIRGGQSGPTVTEAKKPETGSVLKSRNVRPGLYTR